MKELDQEIKDLASAVFHPMNLFVYGTLLVPRIWEAVSGRKELQCAEGVISGYRIFRVNGGDFPGIVETKQHEDQVPGRIFYDVPEVAMKRLDAYEDRFYDRRDLEVTLHDGTADRAYAYVVPSSLAESILSSDPWTLEWFQEHALEDYWERIFGA